MQAEQILQGLIVIVILIMAALAFIYLRRRRLLWYEYILWGLLALILPILGPFLVIAFHPGELLRD